MGQMDTAIHERVAQKENELNATYDEKMRNYEERCVHRSLIFSCCHLLNSFQGTGSAPPGFPLEGPAS